MTSTMAAFAKGDRFERPALELSRAWTDAYIAAVEDEAMARYPDLVPPMGLAALTVRSLLEEAPLPDGAIHAAQELAFNAPVRVAESLAVTAAVVNRNERAGWVLLVVETAVTNAAGNEVLSGRSTLTFPAGGDASLDELPEAAPLDHRDDPPVITRQLSQQKIAAYADASGDHNPLHIDPAFAARTRFGGTIAHGMLILSYLSEMMTIECGEDWMSAGAMKVRFRGAARPGETITTYRAPRGDRAWDIEARNGRNELLVSGGARLR